MDYCRGRGHCNISIQLSEENISKDAGFYCPYTQRENSALTPNIHVNYYISRQSNNKYMQ